MVSRERVCQFLTDKLEIKDLEERLKEKPVEVIEEIVRNMHRIPFQNVTFLSEKPEIRRAPTLEESLDMVLTQGFGGLCYTMNAVLCLILQSLGFTARLVLAAVFSPDHNNHVAVILQNVLDQDDIFLADVGFAQPTFSLVSLDFEKEGNIYNNSFVTFKYIKEGDTFIRLVQTTSSEKDGFIVKDGWKYCYWFSLEHVTWEKIWEELHKNVYGNSDMAKFWDNLHIMKWVEDKFIGFKNQTLLKEDGGKLHPTEIAEADLQHSIAEIFPEIKEGDITKAIENLKTWKMKKTSVYY